MWTLTADTSSVSRQTVNLLQSSLKPFSSGRQADRQWIYFSLLSNLSLQAGRQTDSESTSVFSQTFLFRQTDRQTANLLQSSLKPFSAYIICMSMKADQGPALFEDHFHPTCRVVVRDRLRCKLFCYWGFRIAYPQVLLWLPVVTRAVF